MGMTVLYQGQGVLRQGESNTCSWATQLCPSPPTHPMFLNLATWG